MNHGGTFWRFVGIPYLMAAVGLLVLSGWNVVWIPDGSYYEPPNACACLECRHTFVTDGEGNLYCSVFPPREIKMASVSERTVFYRRLGGVGISLLGLEKDWGPPSPNMHIGGVSARDNETQGGT